MSLVIVVTTGGVIRYMHGPYQSRRRAEEQHARLARRLRAINEVVTDTDGIARGPLWHSYIWTTDSGDVRASRYRAELRRAEEAV